MFSSWTAYGFGGGTSGGGGVTPSLQQVTDVGNTTDNEIYVQGAVISWVGTGEGGSKFLIGPNAGAGGFDPFAYQSTIIGVDAGLSGQLEQAVFIGGSAGAFNTNQGLVAVGTNAGYGNQGFGCTIVGNYQSPPSNITGNYGIYIGYGAVNENTGQYLVAITNNAMNNSGDYLINIGHNVVNNSGSDVTVIGNTNSVNSSISNSILIGQGGTVYADDCVSFKPGPRQANFLFSTMTGPRDYTLPDASGALLISPFTGAGQMLYSLSASETAAFDIGTNGQFLSIVADVPQFVDTVGDNIYNTDGALVGAREVDMDGFNLQFINAGLFRIENVAGAEGFVYDFNEGVDFTAYDANFSSNIISNVSDGVTVSYVDIATPANNVSFSVKENTIEFVNPSPTGTLMKIASFSSKSIGAALTLADTSSGEVAWKEGFSGIINPGDTITVENGIITAVTP